MAIATSSSTTYLGPTNEKKEEGKRRNLFLPLSLGGNIHDD
jgi:hypothetical protein